MRRIEPPAAMILALGVITVGLLRAATEEGSDLGVGLLVPWLAPLWLVFGVVGWQAARGSRPAMTALAVCGAVVAAATVWWLFSEQTEWPGRVAGVAVVLLCAVAVAARLRAR